MLQYTVDSIAGSRLPLFIGGEWREPASGRHFPSYDPTSGKPWYDIAEADETDVSAAAEAAYSAMRAPGWARLVPTARGEYLFRLADLITDHADELAAIETRDNGKLLKETRAQIRQLGRYYRYFGGASDKIGGETYQVDKPDLLNFTLREPIGVVASIVPWNSPLYMMSCSVAPALASGCAVIVKPSEHASASAIAFADLVAQAGFPSGLFNVVTGPGATTGNALTRASRVAKIAFTGGTATGVKIAQNAAERLLPLNLELGGKSPHVVYADADLERAVNGVAAGVFAAGGQTCVAGSRCFVEQGVYDDLVERVAAAARQVRIGMPTDPETQVGPLALASQVDKVARYVGLAAEQGGRIVAGGGRCSGDGLSEGWFVEPTVVANAHNDMAVARDEIFGPVVAMIPFKNEEELFRLANDTVYGLASGVWTRDIDKAMRFIRNVDAGTVWVNTYRTASVVSPMGGFKQSGYGKHHSLDAMREYSRLKNVMIDYS